MLLNRVVPETGWRGFLIVRLLRRWTAAHAAGENPLPALVELGRKLDLPTTTCIALASLFQLTEHCLGRALASECCCSLALSPDERAVLALIAAAPASGPVLTALQIPPGLPGALAWAVVSVRRLLEEDLLPILDRKPERCPFQGH